MVSAGTAYLTHGDLLIRTRDVERSTELEECDGAARVADGHMLACPRQRTRRGKNGV